MTNRSAAAPRLRKGYAIPALLAIGLISAAVIAYSALLSQASAHQCQVARRVETLSRDSLWLHSAVPAQPRRKWKLVLNRLEANWSQVAKTDPAAAKSLTATYRTFDKTIGSNDRVSAAVADKFSDGCLAEEAILSQAAEQESKQVEYLAAGGAAGLLLCLCIALGLMRRLRLMQFQTTQSYLAAERTAWDKQRRAYDTQRDQLIAELQQAQQHKVELDSLRQSGSRQFEEFFRTLPVACFCVAASGKIVRWNAACETLYGLAAADALEKTLWETIAPETGRQHVESQFQQVLAGDSLGDIDREDRRADGSLLKVRCSLAPLRDASGQIIGCVSANLAITDIARYEQQIEAQRCHLQELQVKLDSSLAEIVEARTPPIASAPEKPQDDSPLHMTEYANPANAIPTASDAADGVRSHTEFQEALISQSESAARTNEPLTIILVDLDNFTEYNQALDYRRGDQALRDIAEMLGKKVRTIDTVARFGADEFAILLPNTNFAGAEIAAQRFQAGIAGLPWKRKKLTASLVIAVLTSDFQNCQTAIDHARKLLQDTKASGPGRIIVADEPESAKPATATRSRRKAA